MAGYMDLYTASFTAHRVQRNSSAVRDPKSWLMLESNCFISVELSIFFARAGPLPLERMSRIREILRMSTPTPTIIKEKSGLVT